jgi:formate hydrogenlyase transcriptional activator
MQASTETKIAAESGLQFTVERCRALLGVSEAIASHRDLGALFHELAERLPGVVPFDFLTLVLHDPARNVMRLHILESRAPSYVQTSDELPVAESPGGLVWSEQRPLLLSSGDIEQRFPRVAPVLRPNHIESLCLLPLTSALRRLGAMGFGSMTIDAYSESDVDFLTLLARQVAVAVDNALHSRDVEIYQQQLAQERDRLRALLEINNALVTNLNRQQLFASISAGLKRVVKLDYISLALLDGDSGLLLYTLDFPDGQGIVKPRPEAIEDCLPRRAIVLEQPVVATAEELAASACTEMMKQAAGRTLKSACFVPLINRGRALGTLNVGSSAENSFERSDLEFLKQVGNQVSIALDNAIAFEQIADFQTRLAEEKLYLEDEIRTEHNFEEIIGDSEALKRVLKQAETVAPTNSTVLIQGETGTGKEVIARAIHHLSPRRNATLIKVNCSAIPAGLLESELFGHERGAFTGAISQKSGKLELADKGTLFLDEIGDVPLELQPKLLRVLQEHEFERLGGTRTIKVDVRVVAATNRDLAQMVADREFRSDLYYRVNVFPLTMPPLRERREDIPLLVRYFAQKYARGMDKQIESIPTETLQALSRWDWPGNVRELENFIERAVILTDGSVLRAPLAELKPLAPDVSPGVLTLEDADREHILRALEASNWVIGGPKGAAQLLGMKRTTLQSRMRKLGITR